MHRSRRDLPSSSSAIHHLVRVFASVKFVPKLVCEIEVRNALDCVICELMGE